MTDASHRTAALDNINDEYKQDTTKNLPKSCLSQFINIPNFDTLREEILAGRKFGGFGGFCPKPPNLKIIVIRQIKFPPNLKIIVIHQIKFPPN